jgi:RHS repeat-associated protein
MGVYVVDSGASNGYRVEEEYVHLDSWRPVAVVRPDAATGMSNPKLFPILTDHLGTPRKVLDGDTGETRWSWDAKQPFGFELPNETPTAGLSSFTFDLRFPGQRYDGETGLFHNGFRDYHPGLGRYVQSDPLGLEAGWNTFAYAGMNPMGNMDPYGLDWMNDVSTFIYNVDQSIVQGRASYF